MSAGRLDVVGAGPGGPQWVTPETREIVERATDLVGYGPYLERLAAPGHRCHDSGNRVELDRATLALDLASTGRRVALVSGGDPGIFAMAAAVCEVMETVAKPAWDSVAVEVHPGVSALQAAAARVGAPLGHDFCAMSLSDNLKPWPMVAKRLMLAARADFAMALYNPRSASRPWQLGEALRLLAREQPASTPVVFARAVGRTDERVLITALGEADAELADMRTLVLVGNSRSRVFHHGGERRVYSPRFYDDSRDSHSTASATE